MTDHKHFSYELPNGYRSPWIWPTVEAATEYGTKRHPDMDVFAVAVSEDSEPVRLAQAHTEMTVAATEVNAWCGQRASGDMMQQTAALRLDAGGVQVDIVGTRTELVQVRDRIVAAFDRGLDGV